MADIKVRIIAEDKASDVLKQTGKALDDTAKKAKEAGGAFEGMGKTMASIAGGLGLQMGLQAIVGGLKNAVVGSFELAAALEQTTVGFTTMLGSGEAASAMLGDLRDFAATTPFQFTDLTEAASRMIAMGTAAEDVIPTLTAVGDAAAGLGLGKAGIDRITLALGQMGAKGKIGGDDLRQLAEAGVPALKYLADAAGVTTAEMSKMIEKGVIPAAEGVDVLVQSMAADFGGLMAEQSKTASGALSNLEDATATLGTEIGKKFLPAVEAAAGGLAVWFATIADGMKDQEESRTSLDELVEAHRRGLISTEELASATTEWDGQSRAFVRTVDDLAAARLLLARAEEDYAFEADRAADSTNGNFTAISKLTPKVDEAKDAALQYKDALAQQSQAMGFVGSAMSDYEKDSATLAEQTAKHQKVVDDLTAAHGKSQAAILAGTGTIVDNTKELDASALAHRDLKQDVEQLNKKQADGKISGEDYTLAMDHLNVKILEQEDAHKKLVETQGTGLTALQLAGTEQGNYTTKLGEMNTKLQEAKDADIALQTQIATRIKEGLVLRDLEDAAENGLTEAEILRIKTTAEALGVADSEAIAGTLRVETAATGLAGAREKYATAFDTSNAEGMAAFTAYADSIATDITNKMEPDLAKAGKAADSAAERVRFLATDYNGIQSKTVEVQINIRETTFRNSVELGQGYSEALAATAVPAIPPGRAAGGPVMGAAGTYLVGEMGPELFNPAGNGMIIPNSALGGMGGGGSLRIGTLNLYGVQSASELFNQLSKEARARGLQFAAN